MSQPRPQLQMRRPRLDRLPPLEDPADGYSIRRATAEDAEGLARTLTLAFPDDPWDAQRVRRDLTEAPDVDATFVIEHDGMIVATASSRYVPDRFPGSGYVHWVAADPGHSGRALGKMATLRVLHHMRERGRSDAVLETDDARLPAIRTYLNLGFLPEDAHPGDLDRWARIFDKLERFQSRKR
jgi:mycothiol synthase